MRYRTDVEYQDGKIAVREGPRPDADTRYELPEVGSGDHLRAGWYNTIKQDAGKLADDPALSAAEQAHSALVNGWESLKEARTAEDPHTNQATHLANIAGATDRLIKQTTERFDRAAESLERRKNELQREFRESLKFSDKHSAELRQVLRSMSPEDRSTAIQKAIESGDGAVLAAIFDAHPTLSGLDHDGQKARWNQALHKHAPQALAYIRAAEKAQDVNRRALMSAFDNEAAMTAAEVRQKHAAAAEKARAARKKIDAWGI